MPIITRSVQIREACLTYIIYSQRSRIRDRDNFGSTYRVLAALNIACRFDPPYIGGRLPSAVDDLSGFAQQCEDWWDGEVRQEKMTFIEMYEGPPPLVSGRPTYRSLYSMSFTEGISRLPSIERVLCAEGDLCVKITDLFWPWFLTAAPRLKNDMTTRTMILIMCVLTSHPTSTF